VKKTAPRKTAAATEPVGSADDPTRHLRADARRNYERLVEAAHVVFARDGADASMEAIAREAGVGVGTLYRHFPRRIDLVEAVYRTDVDELTAAAEKAVANLEPWPAVEAFTQAFRRYARTKRTFLTELHEAFEKNPDLKSESRERIDQAWDLVVGRAQAAGVLRTDVTGRDLMQLITPMCTNASVSDDQADRLLAVVIDGLRIRA
jgi:AcrR family transcriptional regulator